VSLLTVISALTELTFDHWEENFFS